MELKDGQTLLPYYGTIRDTVRGLDSLITDMLTKGATATVAILVGPLAIFKTPDGKIEWSFAFFTSIFAVPAALYLLIAIAFYADLLRRAVTVSKGLEKDIFKDDETLWLTTVLDQNPLAGGKRGTILYLEMVVLLYFTSALFSVSYLQFWKDPTDWRLYYFPALIVILAVTIFFLDHWKVSGPCQGRFLGWSVCIVMALCALVVWSVSSLM